ncbi:FAD-dependent monooxygenase [Nodularia sphaerocarpa]|uniref:FAD-dependent monooxygenase n=1 Tax=Nodularia sphaerocarpa TaxID=137816 RepID=UPI001EFBF8E0|nr:FAD-dependent monooxygenase [Nodularia sphaerocarpa]MDB9372952.1 FAD-dependent monooxygenase [Nodularia sphaerocarpa CS-585]MDB9377478.1 FAD-dependent monooxygenase [Nodularia sphaerocarpa CS-585A2]ULP71691.1 6-methylpretetramide 4-monooxygenase [Nodularia sphaerocarpa UHCC 0038]
MAQIIIVGAGPTGAALALLLVKRGINITLIEAAKDFYRVFRGEGLMPSGLDALTQMGLSTLLENIPSRKLDGWEFIIQGKQLFRVDEPMGSTRPCTLVSQPPLLKALISEAEIHDEFEFIQGVSVKDLFWSNDRVSSVILSDGRQLTADLVIGADGRNSIVRERAGLKLVHQPKNIDILWFKLAASPQFAADNVFRTIVNSDRVFSIFHGAESGKLHLAYVISAKEKTDYKQADWAEIFASLSPSWLAEHFRHHADSIESPIKLSVVVGCCPQWHAPGIMLLGDAAHPMSPVRAQGINVALRDVIVTANHLVPILQANSEHQKIDLALSKIQAEREPEIIRAQQLQLQEAAQGELLRKNLFVRSLLVQFAPMLRTIIKQSWLRRQREMRDGITNVSLKV